ncbi:MAG: alpha/beta hydrolase [Rubrivivax sp.]|nr:alpha/beta hydrolase [Rubrivivax sp.]
MKCTVEGRTAYAYTGGKPLDPALPGIVFIHGALHDHSVWIQQTRYLAHHGHAVLAVDLPGHGRSEGPPLGVPEAADWICALVDAAGLSRVALAGHSMGSLIALEAAARLGERASHLFLIGSAYPMKVSATLLELCRSDVLKAIDLVNNLSLSSHASKPSSPGPGFVLHGGNRALMRRMQAGWTGGNLFLHDFQVCDAYAGLEAAAPQVRCPSTLIAGERDQMTSPKAMAPLIAALQPRVRRLASGHALYAEAPDALLQALLDGLRG